MKLRNLAVGAALLATAACMDGPTAPQCDTLTNQTASTQGDTVTTTTSLRYIDTLVPSETAATAESCRLAQVHYDLYLTQGGERIDSGTFVFTPGQHQVISGFEQGVVGMQVGGERRLIVPPSLAYGADPQHDSSGEVVIPANSTLLFDVELQAVEQD